MAAYIFFLAVTVAVAVMGLLYIFMPSRVYMRGENIWPDADPNLLKRIFGVCLLFICLIMIDLQFGH